MNILDRTKNSRGALILGVLALSLLLRADGCVTSEREVGGVFAVTLTAEWTTQGFTENTATDNGNAGDFAAEILDALDDADLSAVRRARDDGERLTVAGLRAEVTRSGGHDAAREGTVRVDTGTGLQTLCVVSVPGNSAGQVATPGDGSLTLSGSGLLALQVVARTFLDQYLAGDVDGARSTLNSLLWQAQWSSSPPPSAGSPADVDWFTEVILHIPATYTVETIGS